MRKITNVTIEDITSIDPDKFKIINDKYKDYEFDRNQKYLEAFESHFASNLLTTSDVIDNNFKVDIYNNPDIIREILYKYNIQILGIKALKKNDSNKNNNNKIEKDKLGIKNIGEPRSIEELFMHLNILDLPSTSSPQDIYIVGYDNKYNFT